MSDQYETEYDYGEIRYESLPYDEFKMEAAVKEASTLPFKSMPQIAEDHGVPVEHLRTEFAAYKARLHNKNQN